jgi:hypothetical protein
VDVERRGRGLAEGVVHERRRLRREGLGVERWRLGCEEFGLGRWREVRGLRSEGSREGVGGRHEGRGERLGREVCWHGLVERGELVAAGAGEPGGRGGPECAGHVGWRRAVVCRWRSVVQACGRSFVRFRGAENVTASCRPFVTRVDGWGGSVESGRVLVRGATKVFCVCEIWLGSSVICG